MLTLHLVHQWILRSEQLSWHNGLLATTAEIQKRPNPNFQSRCVDQTVLPKWEKIKYKSLVKYLTQLKNFFWGFNLCNHLTLYPLGLWPKGCLYIKFPGFILFKRRTKGRIVGCLFLILQMFQCWFYTFFFIFLHAPNMSLSYVWWKRYFFHDFWMFFIFFNHVNACANMHLLVKIHNICQSC